MNPPDQLPRKADAKPFKYTAAEWATIKAAFPTSLAVGANLRAARLELQASATLYLVVSETYKTRFRGRLKARQVADRKLVNLIAFAERHNYSEMLPGLRDAEARSLPIVQSLAMSASSHQGRASFERDQFYMSVLSTWTALGGILKISRNNLPEKQTPGGPLLRFLNATLQPVMRENTPGAEGLVTLVKSHLKPKPRKPKKVFPFQKKSGTTIWRSLHLTEINGATRNEVADEESQGKFRRRPHRVAD